MKTLQDAEMLGKALVDTANMAGVKCIGPINRMGNSYSNLDIIINNTYFNRLSNRRDDWK